MHAIIYSSTEYFLLYIYVHVILCRRVVKHVPYRFITAKTMISRGSVHRTTQVPRQTTFLRSIGKREGKKVEGTYVRFAGQRALG